MTSCSRSLYRNRTKAATNNPLIKASRSYNHLITRHPHFHSASFPFPAFNRYNLYLKLNITLYINMNMNYQSGASVIKRLKSKTIPFGVIGSKLTTGRRGESGYSTYHK